jgi:pantoate--beta-alanine ligase
MQIFHDIHPLRDFRRQLLLAQKSVGFVPTMGALHAGHLSLIRQAAQENTNVVVSIYVNPLQFGVNEDLDTYPRTWAEDLEMLMALDQEFAEANAESTEECTLSGHSATSPFPSRVLGRISAIFAPTTRVMYPTLPPTSENGTFVTVTPLASLLEGTSRPTFFRGVATVCVKLFNIVTPDRVYFGQKDVQQTVIIKRLVKDLCMPIEVVIGPTVREGDGLAMSSRNVYLGRRRRPSALVLVRALRMAEEQYMSGKLTRDDILGPTQSLLQLLADEQEQLPGEQRVRFEVDYISLADKESLEEIGIVNEAKGAILSGAIIMLPVEKPLEGEDDGGISVRLIDNIILDPRR